MSLTDCSIRDHLTKRKKSYVKEIFGPQEDVQLEYISTGQSKIMRGEENLQNMLLAG